MSVATPRRSTPTPPSLDDSRETEETPERTSSGSSDGYGGAVDAAVETSECVVVLKRELAKTTPMMTRMATRRSERRTPLPATEETRHGDDASPVPPVVVAVVESIHVAPASPPASSFLSIPSSPTATVSTATIATPPRPTQNSPSRSSARLTTPTQAQSTPERAHRHQRVASSMRLSIQTPPIIPGQESATRRSQITPPPSDRMLDRRNPPQPPRKAKKKRRLNSQYPQAVDRVAASSPTAQLMVSPARGPIPRLPRLSSEDGSTRSGDATPSPSSNPLFPHLLMMPPSRVFRSLESEFESVADEQPHSLRLHSPPTIPRVTRIFQGGNGTASATGSPSQVRVKPRATRAPSVSITTTTSTSPHAAATTTTSASTSPSTSQL